MTVNLDAITPPDRFGSQLPDDPPVQRDPSGHDQFIPLSQPFQPGSPVAVRIAGRVSQGNIAGADVTLKSADSLELFLGATILGGAKKSPFHGFRKVSNIAAGTRIAF